jgi:hypothetical protein
VSSADSWMRPPGSLGFVACDGAREKAGIFYFLFLLRRICWSTRLGRASPSLPPEIHVWISQGQFVLFTKVNSAKYKEYDKI